MLRNKNSIIVTLIIGLVMSLQLLNAGQYSAQSMYAVVKGHDEQLRTISARVNLLQDNYVTLVRSINTLQKDLQTEKQKNIRLQNTVETLKQQMYKDRQQMSQNLNNVINKVSEQTSKAINSVAKQQAAAQASSSRTSSRSGDGPIGNGNFAEYVVQPGATLSAISKAYKVSVKSIKKANGLHNDIIRVGQKLYIPQD
jgi:LysM repeat protein